MSQRHSGAVQKCFDFKLLKKKFFSEEERIVNYNFQSGFKFRKKMKPVSSE